MKLAKSILLGLVIMATSFPIFGQSAPEGFRDLKWGATHEQVLLAFPSASCDSRQSDCSIGRAYSMERRSTRFL